MQEEEDGVEGIIEFFKKYDRHLIAIMILFTALIGMKICYDLGYVRGATDICKNTGGNPILIGSDDIKDGKCLVIEENEVDNNLGLSYNQIKEFEKVIENAKS